MLFGHNNLTILRIDRGDVVVFCYNPFGVFGITVQENMARIQLHLTNETKYLIVINLIESIFIIKLLTYYDIIIINAP